MVTLLSFTYPFTAVLSNKIQSVLQLIKFFAINISQWLHIVAPKITSKISLVKWDEMTAKNMYDLHRGLLGLYPLTTKFGDKTIKLFDVQQTLKPISVTNAENDVPGNQSIVIPVWFSTALNQFQELWNVKPSVYS